MARNIIGKMIGDDVGINIIAPDENPETEVRRVTLTIRPNVYEKAKEKCDSLGVSVNDAINNFLESWVGE